MINFNIKFLTVRNTWFFWIFFALAFSFLGYLAYTFESAPFGDVTYVYRYWVSMAAGGQGIVGIDSPWVYPLGAFIPMGIAAILGGSEFYVAGWFFLVVLLNLSTMVLLRSSKFLGERRFAASWIYVMFALLLGPISVSRLDSIVTPLLLMGLVWAKRFPLISTISLTAAMWIKVWPAALIAGGIVFLKKRGVIAVTSGIMSFAIVAIALFLGAGTNVYSFLTQQSSRGLQIESLTATPYLWLAKFSPDLAGVYFDYEIVTYQVSGPGVEPLTSLTTILLAGLVFGVFILGIYKLKAGSAPFDIYLAVSMATVGILLTFNKVGSPQFIFSLVAPILATFIFDLGKSKLLIWLGLVVAFLTSLVFPYFYQGILDLNPVMLFVLTIRNLLLVGLVLLSVTQLSMLKPERRLFEHG